MFDQGLEFCPWHRLEPTIYEPAHPLSDCGSILVVVEADNAPGGDPGFFALLAVSRSISKGPLASSHREVAFSEIEFNGLPAYNSGRDREMPQRLKTTNSDIHFMPLESSLPSHS